jgi:hypothetical protein
MRNAGITGPPDSVAARWVTSPRPRTRK